MSIKGKRVLVSGGSSGIGAALVAQLAELGAVVYSIDRRKSDTPVKDVSYMLADLSKLNEIENVLVGIKRIDLLISGAGVMRRGTIFESGEEDFDYLINNNLKSAWALLKAVKSHLSPKATIVQLSSGHALKPEPNPGLYTLTKKATSALAEILALTCPEYVVKVVYPGPVLTPLLLSERSDDDKERISKIAHKPDEIAKKIMQFIGSDKKTLSFNEDTWDYEAG